MKPKGADLSHKRPVEQSTSNHNGGPGITVGGVVTDVSCLALGGSAAVAVFSTSLSPLLGIPLALVAAALHIPQWRFQAVDYLAVLFGVLSFVSLLWTSVEHLTLQHSLRMGGVLALFVALRLAIQGRRELMAAASGYLVGCGYSIYLLSRQDAVGPVDWRFDSTRSLTVEGLNQNYVAYSLAAGVAVLGFLVARRRRAMLLSLLPIGAIYWGIGLTGARGGLLGFALALLWWLCPPRMRSVAWRVMVPGVCLFVVAVSSGVLDAGLRALFPASHSREIGDLNGRLTVWPIARGVLEDHPVLGAGAGSFPSFNPWSIYAHNVLLDVGTGLGFVGIVLFVALLATVFVQGSKGARTFERDCCAGLTVLALLPPLLSGYWYASPAVWVVLALCSRLNVAFPAGRDDREDEPVHRLESSTNVPRSQGLPKRGALR